MRGLTKVAATLCALVMLYAISALVLAFMVLGGNQLALLLRALFVRVLLAGAIGTIGGIAVGYPWAKTLREYKLHLDRETFTDRKIDYRGLFIAICVSAVLIVGVNYATYQDLSRTAEATLAMLVPVSVGLVAFFGVLASCFLLAARRL